MMQYTRFSPDVPSARSVNWGWIGFLRSDGPLCRYNAGANNNFNIIFNPSFSIPDRLQTGHIQPMIIYDHFCTAIYGSPAMLFEAISIKKQNDSRFDAG